MTSRSLGLLQTQWKRENHEKELLSRSKNQVRDPEEILNYLQIGSNRLGAI